MTNLDRLGESAARLGSLYWRWLLGGILLMSLIAVVGPDKLWRTAQTASPRWMVVVLAFAAIWLAIGGINVWILLRRLAGVRLSTFLRIYVASWAAALLLPGQLGDATQIILLRKHGVTTDQSGAAYVVDKVLSLTWMLGVAAAGAMLYLPSLGGKLWIFLLPLALVPFALLGLVAVRFMTRGQKGFLARLRAWIDRLLTQLRLFLSYPKTLVLNFILTVVKWLAMAAIYLAAFRAFGAAIPFVQASTIPVMSSLVGYIPITVGGAGTMEWTAVALFGRLGVPAATVVSAFILQRIILLLVGAALVLGAGRARAAGEEPSDEQDANVAPAAGQLDAPRGRPRESRPAPGD